MVEQRNEGALDLRKVESPERLGGLLERKRREEGRDGPGIAAFAEGDGRLGLQALAAKKFGEQFMRALEGEQLAQQGQHSAPHGGGGLKVERHAYGGIQAAVPEVNRREGAHGGVWVGARPFTRPPGFLRGGVGSNQVAERGLAHARRRVTERALLEDGGRGGGAHRAGDIEQRVDSPQEVFKIAPESVRRLGDPPASDLDGLSEVQEALPCFGAERCEVWGGAV